VTLVRKFLGARAGEEGAVALAFAYFFMLMCSYYLLRPLRDAMAIEAGLENLPWLYVGTFAVTLVLSPGFAALVARVRKTLLLPLTHGFFAANLLVFYLLFKLVPDARLLAAAFFIWVSAFNMFVVSVFWSFMADVFRDEEAKRLFGPIAAGGGTGAILGPLLMQYLTPRIGVDAVVGLSMLFLLGTLPCIRGLSRWAERRHGRFLLDPQARIGGGVLTGLLLVARSPYLMGITAVILISSTAAAFMYNEHLRFVEAGYPDLGSRGQFLGRIEFAVSLTSWLFQGVVVGWLIRRFDVRGALVAVPIAALASFLALAAAPVLLVLAAGQVLRRAGEYGIAKPSREVLFTVVDAETKYKAKNFIDTVLQRAGDLVGVWLFAVLHAAGVGLVGHAWICAALMIPATAIALRLGRAFERRQDGTSPPATGPIPGHMKGGGHEALRRPKAAAHATRGSGVACRLRRPAAHGRSRADPACDTAHRRAVARLGARHVAGVGRAGCRQRVRSRTRHHAQLPRGGRPRHRQFADVRAFGRAHRRHPVPDPACNASVPRDQSLDQRARGGSAPARQLTSLPACRDDRPRAGP